MTFELLIFSISCSCVFCSKATYAFWVSHVVICCSWVFYVFFVKEATHDFWVSQGLISCSCVFFVFLVRLLMPFEFLMLLMGSQKFLDFFLIKATHNFRDSHDFCFCCSWFVFFKATHDFWVSHVFIPCSFFWWF